MSAAARIALTGQGYHSTADDALGAVSDEANQFPPLPPRLDVYGLDRFSDVLSNTWIWIAVGVSLTWWLY